MCIHDPAARCGFDGSCNIREQRLDGILEGLRLAGVLNEPSKRHRDPQTDGYEPDDPKPGCQPTPKLMRTL
jgi:hypothetical protein